MSGPPDGPILVIKLSSLGDFLMCLGAFKAIRAHHGDDKVVLLTTEPYADLGQACGCFDEVWRDSRPRPLDPTGWWRLAERLRRARFRRVYDLQLSQRTGWYFRLLGPRWPEWIGKVPGCSHRYRQPATPRHIMERHAELLALAGIRWVPAPDLGFLEADLGRFALPPSYALLTPGSSPHRQVKRWPVERYGELAMALAERGLTPVVIGGAAEREAGRALARAYPQTLDLCGRTDLAELASLAGARPSWWVTTPDRSTSPPYAARRSWPCSAGSPIRSRRGLRGRRSLCCSATPWPACRSPRCWRRSTERWAQGDTGPSAGQHSGARPRRASRT